MPENAVPGHLYLINYYFNTLTSSSPTAMIQGFKVLALEKDPAKTPAEIAYQPVNIGANATGLANPYAQTVRAGATYTVSVPPLDGRAAIGYTLCIDRTDCHGNTPTPGNSVTVSLPDGAGHYADLWWHYTPVPAPGVGR